MSAAQPALAVPVETQCVRRGLAGFFVSGLLMSFPGAILPAWEAYLEPDLTAVGKYFLMLAIGIWLGFYVARRLVRAKGTGFALVLACSLAAGAFVYLAFSGPPAAPLWRLLGLFWLGGAAGILNTALFHAVSPAYERDRAATMNLAGALFGMGCLATALIVALTVYALRVPGILVSLAAIPALFAFLFARTKFAVQPPPLPPRNQTLRDFRTPLAVVLGLLLFFQFASEWSIAGWLPVFLIRRLGSSAVASLWMLACFWGALLTGRFAAQAILPRANHARLLIGSVAIELLGYLLLTFTNNLFGASVGILGLAAGFALTYPLVVGKIGARFAHYHPGFFNGIFSVAFAGALLGPWLLGYMAQDFGMRAVLVLPLIATIAVFVLVGVIMLVASLSRV